MRPERDESLERFPVILETGILPRILRCHSEIVESSNPGGEYLIPRFHLKSDFADFSTVWCAKSETSDFAGMTSQGVHQNDSRRPKTALASAML
jgi:hypothetical protein